MESVVDVDMLQAAGQALITIADPGRLFYLLVGVCLGLVIGLIPGIGGLTGFAILVPFTYKMDPVAALAMLIGMQAVTTTSDTIPAVLLGVPGTASAQATVLDGHQMAKNGEASRALGAGYTASLLGGIIGAVLLAFSIPLIRPFVLAIGTPELFAITALAMAMVATLSGNTPLRGLSVACLGIMLAMIGTETQTVQERWTGDFLYLWDGLPMIPVMLGLFALPELCDLSISKKAFAEDLGYNLKEGRRRGIFDALKHWFLVIRCSVIGVVCGAIPGFSGSIVDWMAYGHAARTEKGAEKSFSKGDVRGVKAPEASSNAINSGSLGTTLVFGIPGSAAMAILMGAMLVHGIVPGPKMPTEQLDITYAMVWSMALANIFGALACIFLSIHFARLATLRYTLLLPAILVVIYIGAYQATSDWGDIAVLFLFGLLGWIMKRLNWPRPPLVLGFVLGDLMENYLGISINRYGAEWMASPVVIAIIFVAIGILSKPLITEIRHNGLRGLIIFSRPIFKIADIFYFGLIAITVIMLVEAAAWQFSARIGPQVAGGILLLCTSLSLLNTTMSRSVPVVEGMNNKHRGIYMDLSSRNEDMSNALIIHRAVQFFMWFLLFVAMMALIGLIPSIPLFVIGYLRLEGREPWRLTLKYAAGVTILIYLIFEEAIHVFWPQSLLGQMFPELARLIPSV